MSLGQSDQGRKPSRVPNRVLHVFAVCGRAGTEAVMRFLIRGLKDQGVESEAFFQRDIGGGPLFEELCPVHWEADTSLESLLRSGRFDAVHAITSASTMGLVEAVRRSGFQGPVVTACHNDYVIGWNRSNADAVVALTGWWAEKIRPYTDLPLQVIGNPVDLDRFQPSTEPHSGPPILGWVGRSADPNKNIARLRDLIGALPEGRYSVHVADGNVRADAGELFGPLAGRLAFYGQIGYPEMPHFYQRIAASGGMLVSTSDDEAFPMAVLEAMACGCPVLVPDAWGSDEIVEHGVTGYVYRRQEGVAGMLRGLVAFEAPSAHRTASVASRAVVESRYSLRAVTDQYLALLSQPSRRLDTPAQRAAWTLRSLAFYLRPVPHSMTHYRPRRALEALDRAVRASKEGLVLQCRAELMRALSSFPPVFLQSWRAKFLVRALLLSRYD